MSRDDTDEFKGGWLFELYTKYVTEPESKRDVYGYTVLVVGYVLSMAGMVVYLVGPTGGTLDPITALFREVSFTTAGVGLVITLFGIVLMLPVRRWGVLAGAIGTAMGLGAAAWFVDVYPRFWGVGTPEYSAQIISLYTAGVAIVAGVVVLVPVVTGERSYFAAAGEVLGQDHPDIMIGKTDRDGLFTIYKHEADWTWRLLDQEAIAASTDGFLSRLETENRVDWVKAAVADAALLEITHAAFRLYRAGEGRWRWLLMSEGGAVIADSGDEFPDRSAAEAAVHDLKEFGQDATVITIEGAAFETEPEGNGVRWRLVDERHTPLAVAPDRSSDRRAARDAAAGFSDAAVSAPSFTVETYGVELLEEGGRWSWRLLDTELDVLGRATEDHESKGHVEEAAYDTIDRLATAPIIDATASAYDIYETAGDRWDWRLVTPEDRTVARGPAPAETEDAAVETLGAFREGARSADLVEIRDQDFELYRDDDDWHWRLVDADRNVRAHSVDTYDSQLAAAAAIEHLRLHAPDADLIEIERAAFQIYESDAGQWRWRLLDEDGNVLADSSEGEYDSRGGALQAMDTLREYAPDAEQLEIETAAFELFEEAGEWGWRLVDDIGETIARGTRRYGSREAAQADMDALRDEVSGVDARVMDDGVFQLYHDDEDTWWWRFVLPDGSIVGESPEGFGTRHEAEDAIETLQDEHARADVHTVGRLAVLVDRSGERWSWSLVDQDRHPVVTGTVNYDGQRAARSAVEDIQASAASVTVFEISETAFLVAEDDGWTWSLVDATHAPLAVAPTAYETAAAAEEAATTVAELAETAAFLEYETAAFEAVEDDEGLWRWRLIDEERTPLATSTEQHVSRESVEAAIEAVRAALPEASVLEIERAAFELHGDEDGWRWRLIDETGNELAESLRPHESRSEAREAMNTVKAHAPEAWTTVAD